MSNVSLYPLGQPSFISQRSNLGSQGASELSVITTRSPKKSMRPRRTPPTFGSQSQSIAPAASILALSDLNPNDKITLDSELSNLGFHVEDKVLVLDENNNVIAQYLKASTDNGNGTLIEIDTEDFVLVKPQDPILEPVNIGIQDYPALNRSLDDFGISEKTIAGLSIDCDNGVCVVHPDRTQQSFIHPSAISNGMNSPRTPRTPGSMRTGCSLGCPKSSCPVVRLSQVRSSSDEVLTDISSASKKIRASNAKKLNENLTATAKNLDEINKEYKTFYTNQKASLEALSRDIQQLESFQKAYVAKGDSLCGAERAKYEQVLYNLKVRYQYLDKILAVDQEVAALNGKLEAAKKQLAQANKILAERKVGFGRTLLPAKSASGCSQQSQLLL